MAKSAQTVVISEFKAKCLAILRRVHKTGQPVVITRRGERIAEIHPPSPAKAKPGWLGCMKDDVQILGDILAPALPVEEWNLPE